MATPATHRLNPLHRRNEENRRHQAGVASRRGEWIRRNRYYYDALGRLLRHIVEPGRCVLNLRSMTGVLLDAMRPARGVGVELGPEMVEAARREHPGFEYLEAWPEEFRPSETFDYILVSELGDIADLQRALMNLRGACRRHTRILLYSYNHLWEPLVKLAERLGWKVPSTEQNWFTSGDLENLLELSGFEYLKTYRILLFPKYIPLLSAFLNGFVARLPGFHRLCFVEMIVGRPRMAPGDASVSVIVPCKNERGNVEDAVRRIPEMGRGTEIVFCDDRSTDGTGEEIRRVQAAYPRRAIRLVEGPGISKARNVRAGFEAATGDVLMILDGDLAVMPEQLPYFYDAIASGRAEFVNGSRLVYPVPEQAMRSANMIGNKLFGMMFSWLLGQRTRDTLCGTKVLWRSDWERMRPLVGTWGVEDRWGDYELLFGAAKLNLRIVDQPVHYQERVYGATKMTRVFRNGLRMLRMCLRGFVRLKLGF